MKKIIALLIGSLGLTSFNALAVSDYSEINFAGTVLPSCMIENVSANSATFANARASVESDLRGSFTFSAYCTTDGTGLVPFTIGSTAVNHFNSTHGIGVQLFSDAGYTNNLFTTPLAVTPVTAVSSHTVYVRLTGSQDGTWAPVPGTSAYSFNIVSVGALTITF